MAGTTGLEPATSAVTGQHSNQLSYVPKLNGSRRSSDFISHTPLLRFNSSSVPELRISFRCVAAVEECRPLVHSA
jgi:hypothetical protein